MQYQSFMLCDIRHTYTTRMLYTVLPSENYAPDGSTQHGLLQSLVEDCNRLFTSGFEARLQNCKTSVSSLIGHYKPLPFQWTFSCFGCWQVTSSTTRTRLFMQCIGVKGDWPWLRSAFRLSTGFRCRRLCHLCPSRES